MFHTQGTDAEGDIARFEAELKYQRSLDAARTFLEEHAKLRQQIAEAEMLLRTDEYYQLHMPEDRARLALRDRAIGYLDEAAKDEPCEACMEQFRHNKIFGGQSCHRCMAEPPAMPAPAPANGSTSKAKKDSQRGQKRSPSPSRASSRSRSNSPQLPRHKVTPPPQTPMPKSPAPPKQRWEDSPAQELTEPAEPMSADLPPAPPVWTLSRVPKGGAQRAQEEASPPRQQPAAAAPAPAALLRSPNSQVTQKLSVTPAKTPKLAPWIGRTPRFPGE